jgi:transketolase
VAEQNMTSIAAGLALCGKTVFTYSIANFPTLRCVEQIRNDVCYHNANVKVVSVGGGLGYGSLGVTHHATEDVAVLRSLPNMIVVSPGDPVETQAATRALAARHGPAYLRLGRAGEPVVHSGGIDFEIGRAITVREGDDLCIFATGGLLMNAVKSADILKQQGIYARVVSMHTIKPLDSGAILSAARRTGAIFTLEEHGIVGGLGSAVAEVIAETCDQRIIFKRLGLPSAFTSEVGRQEHLWGKYNLLPHQIADGIQRAVRRAAAAD